jgi:glutamate dehydrogenase
VGERFRAQIERHRLRHEIIATVAVNDLVNRMGVTFVVRMSERTGAGAADVARAYFAARDAFGLDDLWRGIEALDATVPTATQYGLLLEVRQLGERAAGWLVKNRPLPLDVAAAVAEFGPRLADLAANLDRVVATDDLDEIRRRTQTYAEQGVPEEVARRVASLDFLFPGLDIVRISAAAGQPVERVGRTFFELGNRFAFDWLRDTAERIDPESHWDKLAVSAIVDDLQSQQCELAARVLKEADGAEGDPDRLIAEWIERRRAPVDRTDSLIAELRQATTPDLAMLAVANRQLRSLVTF